MTGAEAITAILLAQGIRTVFSLAGASHTHLLAALEDAGVAIVSSRHESGTVGSADGYARALADKRPERPGIALIVAEQGLANAIGGLAVAQAAGSPVVVLAAAPPHGGNETAAWTDHDRLLLAEPVCKWVRAVPSAGRLADYMEAAIRIALEGRPGPVLLLVPQDLFLAEVGALAPEPVDRPLALPSPDALAAAARVLDSARRPIAIAGLGAMRGRAGDALRELEDRGVPVLGNGSGRGLVAEDDRIGFSWPYAQRAANLADCVIVVGEMLTQRFGHGRAPRFAADAKFIQIDTSPAGFDRNRRNAVSLLGEPDPALAGVLERSKGRWDGGWLAEALVAKAEFVARRAAEESTQIHPLRLGAALAERIGPRVFVVGDGADIQNWMYASLRIVRPGGFADHFQLGAMGSGTPLAVGAAAAFAKEARAGAEAVTTLLVTGDGAIGFHPGELHAAAMAGLDLKVVVGNDGAWGTEAHGQAAAIGRTINTELGQLPYARLGEAFGLPGYTACTADALSAGIEALFASRGPALLDVRIDPHAGSELKSNPLATSILFSDLG